MIRRAQLPHFGEETAASHTKHGFIMRRIPVFPNSLQPSTYLTDYKKSNDPGPFYPGFALIAPTFQGHYTCFLDSIAVQVWFYMSGKNVAGSGSGFPHHITQRGNRRREQTKREAGIGMVSLDSRHEREMIIGTSLPGFNGREGL